MEIKVKMTHGQAVIPSKAHESDSGYDLTIIEKVKENGNMVMFDTGIAVEPPDGFYIDVAPRSSIYKSGYIFANSFGVIDSSYRGSIKVVLIKIDENAPEIELPCRIGQMILRPLIQADITPVLELDKTVRGDGGFGSSNK